MSRRESNFWRWSKRATRAPSLLRAPHRLCHRGGRHRSGDAGQGNAHDWDGLRSLIGDDCRLDLVSRSQRRGKQVGFYFARIREGKSLTPRGAAGGTAGARGVCPGRGEAGVFHPSRVRRRARSVYSRLSLRAFYRRRSGFRSRRRFPPLVRLSSAGTRPAGGHHLPEEDESPTPTEAGERRKRSSYRRTRFCTGVRRGIDNDHYVLSAFPPGTYGVASLGPGPFDRTYRLCG
jgi:hypothetical protein